ncbi:MAG: putative phytoene synthase [Rhodospirillaceae bacterium]|nr:MAG: putative phytoene synthase [Rhodospirillaceae bacterium]
MFTDATFETNAAPRLTGKTRRDENFPVGSFLLPKTIRPVVAAFYRFARAADDIADDPGLDRDTKLARLEAMDTALVHEALSGQAEPARCLREILHQGGFTVDQPRALLKAFQRDAMNEECRNWADLLDYCRLSANPVGRFLLEVHRETAPAAITASDALCTALQILNHVQDCHKDFTALDRVYVPADLLAAEGLDRTVLGTRKAPPGLLRVFDHMLNTVGDLLVTARPLPSTLACRGFRTEAGMIVQLAARLRQRLWRRDVLARFRGLRRIDWVLAAGAGLTAGLQGK